MNAVKLLKQVFTGITILIVSGVYQISPVKAGDLIFVFEDANKVKYYLNEDWLKATGHGFVDFVYTVRLPKPDKNGILFIDANVKGHCATLRLGIKSIQLYNVNDNLVGEKQLESLDMDIVEAGSAQYLVLDAACRILSDSL